MFRSLVPDRKLAQQRRQIIDEEFKKEKVELSIASIRKVIKLSKMNRQNSARRKQQSIYVNLNSVFNNQSRPQSSDSSWHGFHLFDKMAKTSENLTQYPIDNQVSNKISNKGCKNLSKMISPTLAQLYLNNNQIGSSGVAHLSKSQWPNLDYIVLYHNRIGEEGVDYLLKSNWPNIKSFHLCWNNIKIEKKVWLVLGRWRKIKDIGLLEENEEQQFCGSAQSLLIRNRYPKAGFNIVTLIRHMTA